ncbi:flagellar hook capping FlgD N-terminal domain-containing protein [Jannaschia sp. 2305UL9-9]|uniref:flagellar hook capping FlgD N-terminal domain-containing protein n=1 Tax=Jannaschia sp. 2305UL9-9 TaxID=3121638 RepID=UPI0035278F1D
MDIASTTQAITPAASTEAQARVSLSSDLDTFLKLLTAQIENQDPLEPADGTEYAAQLAQFSNVEQSVRTNELLAEMTATLGRQDMAVAAAWIGMDVRHSGPVVVDGTSTPLQFDIPAVADRAEMVVTDASGTEVMRRPIAPTTTGLDWAGGDGTGQVLPDGLYQVQIAAYAGSADLGMTPARHYGRVEEVTLGGEGTTLILSGGIPLGVGDLDALRQGV